MIRRVLSSSAASLLLGACALLPCSWFPPPAPPLLAPAALGEAHATTQVLHVLYDGRAITLQCALQADSAAVVLVALGPLGQRAFSLRYDGLKLEAQASPYAPPGLPPQRVLSDVQLALWPLAAWQERLRGSPWTIAEPAHDVRELYFKRVLLSRVEYEGVEPWHSRIRLQNLILNYTIEIEPQDQ